jgi:hypothetical protein
VAGVDGTQAGPQRTLEGGGKARGEHHHPVYSEKVKRWQSVYLYFNFITGRSKLIK